MDGFEWSYDKSAWIGLDSGWTGLLTILDLQSSLVKQIVFSSGVPAPLADFVILGN